MRARARVSDVLLAGIAITLAAGAISQAVQHLADARAVFSAAQWALGQLPQVGYRGVAVLLPFTGVTLVVLLSQTRALQAVTAGEDLARTRGVPVARMRALILLVGSMGVGASVAWCGPIAFVGLLVPHLVRLTLGAEQRVLLPMSALLGSAFLVACDVLARTLTWGSEWPVGVVTAALGAPALFLLVARRTN
jgi:iron complex transport system permease protein